MRTLMLGWEFPPVISGGLGTACYGLSKALGKIGVGITFVLPSAGGEGPANVRLVDASNPWKALQAGELAHMKFRTVPALLSAYATPQSYSAMIEEMINKQKAGGGHTTGKSFKGKSAHYGHDIFQEIERYAEAVADFAPQEEFDVIHAHDWMTYPAGIAVAKLTGKPLVAQIHSTEFDRCGDNVNQQIYDIERAGLHAADRVIAVSHYTRNILLRRYSVQQEKVDVIHNGIETGQPRVRSSRRKNKVVLFMGRITMQKGPDYFIQAAKRVLEKMPKVKFIVAGTGDMFHRMIDTAAWMGIGHKVRFAGFLQGHDVSRAYEMADLYVMPSVSEPFGIAPLEAMDHDVPVLISKQSGVSEVLSHVLKVDFWDTNEMANKIISVLKHPPLHETLRENGTCQARQIRWEDAAEKCRRVYESVLLSA